MVIDRLAKKVDDALVTTGAVGWAYILLREHGIVLLGVLVLQPHNQVVQLLNLIGKIKSQRRKLHFIDGSVTYLLF